MLEIIEHACLEDYYWLAWIFFVANLTSLDVTTCRYIYIYIYIWKKGPKNWWFRIIITIQGNEKKNKMECGSATNDKCNILPESTSLETSTLEKLRGNFVGAMKEAPPIESDK